MKTYLIRLTAAAILAAVIRRLAPKSGAGRGARLGAGLLVLVCMLEPLGALDLTAGAKAIAKNGYTDVMEADDIALAANEMLEELISQSAEAYILDKARGMGVTAEAEVQVRLKEHYPVPWAATIHSGADAAQREKLTAQIAEELGIPAERQEWLEM